MLGYYYCEHCERTHDDWMHGNKLMVCGVCKTKESIRFNDIIRSGIGKRPFVGTIIPRETQDMVRSHVFGENIFDLNYLREHGADEFVEFLNKNPDEYLKLAYYDFKDPMEVWQDFYDRDRLESKGVDVLSYMPDYFSSC